MTPPKKAPTIPPARAPGSTRLDSVPFAVDTPASPSGVAYDWSVKWAIQVFHNTISLCALITQAVHPHTVLETAPCELIEADKVSGGLLSL
jgi:hypothetical protein